MNGGGKGEKGKGERLCGNAKGGKAKGKKGGKEDKGGKGGKKIWHRSLTWTPPPHMPPPVHAEVEEEEADYTFEE